MTKTYIVKKKEDISGEIIAEVEITQSDVIDMTFTRDYIVKTIAELTKELADYQKLLVDVDATVVSITP